MKKHEEGNETTPPKWGTYEYLANSNPAYLEELYEQYRNDPQNVDEGWRIFFAGFDLKEEIESQRMGLKNLSANGRKTNGGTQTSLEAAGGANTHATATIATTTIATTATSSSNRDLRTGETGDGELDLADKKERAVTKLIQAYRARGYTIAQLNPLATKREEDDEGDLKLAYFGLSEADLDETFSSGQELKIGRASLREILRCLKSVYAGAMGVEFAHCKDSHMRKWIYRSLEPSYGDPGYSHEEKLGIFAFLARAVIFESFLQKKYLGEKRFGLEGGEALIPALERLITKGSELGVEEFVFGMAHRGRLNVLVNILQKSYSQLFREFEGGTLPENVKGDGDVKYHLGQSADIEKNGKNVHLSLAFNPSHLEAVNSIVAGIVHAKCQKYYGANRDKIVPVLLHGDAAVAGQGVVYELANMSQLEGYNNGGTVHIVIDNQIGFTATSQETRSSLYSTDIAYITDSPVFHVNGDDPVKVTYAFELAIAFRQQFKKDIWVNVICYRRRGHNESDDPTFTSPLMYERIRKHKNVLDLYKEQLFKENLLTPQQVSDTHEVFEKELNEQLSEARDANGVKKTIDVNTLNRYWQSIRVAGEEDMQQSISTAVSRETLDKLARRTTEIPKGFNANSKIRRIFDKRWKQYDEAEVVDWAMGETLAYASLLGEKRSVRLAGQDCARGTFSHRHAVLRDMTTERKYIPLETCTKGLARFVSVNTQLSEYSVLGFEYGYSLARPHALVIWEAQFGDFANCAQVIIDQFITSGESKWQRHSGIVLLLPHGYEGMGPEHSSARLERFLQLCANGNMYVVNVTTPANFFHLIRRAIHSPFRKPTIVMSPKSLIRHPLVVSPLSDITGKTNGRFQEVIDDSAVDPKSVRRVLLSSGKIYFDLLAEREKHGLMNIALVRVEQLYPIIKDKLLALKQRYPAATDWVWVQEEPANMGSWSHILLHIPELRLRCISRRFSSSPASGIKKVHERNQRDIVEQAITGNAPDNPAVVTLNAAATATAPRSQQSREDRGEAKSNNSHNSKNASGSNSNSKINSNIKSKAPKPANKKPSQKKVGKPVGKKSHAGT